MSRADKGNQDMPGSVDTGAGPAPEDRIIGDRAVPAKGTLGDDEPAPEEQVYDPDEVLG